MATPNKTSTYAGKNVTPKGIMPPDMVKRHKLTLNTPSQDGVFRRTYRHNRKMKQLFELTKTYRQLVHKSNEARLPQCFRDAIHYLVEPISRGSGQDSRQTPTPDAASDAAVA